MKYDYNHKLVPISQNLRKNMTREEKHLWYDFLKYLPVTVHRQVIIGNYITDFYIPYKELVIELDGRQHEMPDHRDADRTRDQFLMEKGITILRYTNEDIRKRFSTVCNDILQHLELQASDLKR